MIVDRFKASDMAEILARPSSACMASAMGELDGSVLERFDSWTGRINGEVVACAGIMPLWRGRSYAWAVLSQDIGPFGMVRLTRAVRRYLKMSPPGRIEATVVAGFDAGERWLQMLGFERETPAPMRGWLPDGGAANLFARVR